MQKTFGNRRELDDFKKRSLAWADGFDICCYFDSNHFNNQYSNIEAMVCAGKTHEFTATDNCFDDLQKFLDQHKNSVVPGFFGYDLKNQIEDLSSDNPDRLEFPDCYFFVPEHILIFSADSFEIISEDDDLLQIIQNQPLRSVTNPQIQVQARFSKEEYLDAVNKIKAHISRGDIYEANFCQEFYNDDASVDPLKLFSDLNAHSPTPFAGYFKLNGRYILSASPERFLQKRGSKLISQPIKGTAPRNADPAIDKKNKTRLSQDPKERAENVMIVDLVRNDLTKSAVPGSVKAEELFGIYPFQQVYQMISTVVCEANTELSNTAIIKNTFPMGSMTGAPKIEAMKLIERYEKSKRGVFSGAIGYFSSNGDFDFNVVIRSILYDAEKKYLSFQVGSAITFEADAEKEYEECLLKAKAILKILS